MILHLDRSDKRSIQSKLNMQFNLVDIITDILRKNIIAGQIKFNKNIPTQKLASQLGVSRTPIREAFRRLESEGLIETSPGKSFRLKKYTLEEIKETSEVRTILEMAAVAKAVENITDEEIDHMEKVDNELQVETKKKNIMNIKTLNTEFHFTIHRASRNQVLCRTLVPIWNRICGLPMVIISPGIQREEIISEHKAILRSLRNRDKKGCEKAMLEHILHTEEEILKSVRKKPSFD